jgi:chorismate mutase
MTSRSEDIELLRAQIQDLDGRILRLLAQRYAHVRLLGQAKSAADLPVRDKAREAELRLFYSRTAAREGLDPVLVQGIFSLVHAGARAEQDDQRRPARSA